MDTRETPDLMTVTEVADYLRVRERTIYELVRTQRIPSCKLSGKLLFPKRLIELWVAQSADYPQAATHLAAPPPVIAGSHDPLLEWAARESRCGLAILVGGSMAGMHRLLEGQAVACALHIVDPATGQYDAGILAKSLPGLDFVAIEWARRQQGLIVAAGNPAKIGSVGDLRKRGIRVATRQEGSGSALLFSKLVTDAGLKVEELEPPASRSAARPTSPSPCARARPTSASPSRPWPASRASTSCPCNGSASTSSCAASSTSSRRCSGSLAFARTEPFRGRAALLGGYDVANTGAIVFNARR